MKGVPMARKQKENISEVTFSYIGTDGGIFIKIAKRKQSTALFSK